MLAVAVLSYRETGNQVDHVGRSPFGGAPRITRRQSQLESQPCASVRNNPSRRHAFTRLRTEREAWEGEELSDVGQNPDRCSFAEDAGRVQRWVCLVRERPDGKYVQSSDDGGDPDDRVMMDVFDFIRGTSRHKRS